MWSDKVLIDCPRCGHRMFAERGARACDRCMIESTRQVVSPFVQRAMARMLPAKELAR